MGEKPTPDSLTSSANIFSPQNVSLHKKQYGKNTENLRGISHPQCINSTNIN